MNSLRRFPLSEWMLAALALALAPISTATAQHRSPHPHTPPRPVLLGASVSHSGHGRLRLVLRWSEVVRTVHPGRVHLVCAPGHRSGAPCRHAKLVSHRASTIQVFAPNREAAYKLVHVAAGAARGPGGTSPTATMALSPVTASETPANAPTPLSSPATPMALTGPPPALASSFLDSVGVNVHASYSDTAYGQSATIQQELVKLGVHFVRDGACVGCVEQRRVLMGLAAVGIKTDFTMRQPGSPDSLPSLVDMLSGPMSPAVASIEGPNEYDYSGNRNWAADLRSYQQQLYRLVKAAPSLTGIPVLGPSLVSSQDYSALGDLSASVDQGNIHPYPGNQAPLANLASNQQAETAVAPGKPLAVTEVGYHNALASTGGNRPVSELAASVYIPRLFLDFFQAGVTRSFLYEFIDERPDPQHTNQENSFGLLRSDASEKPAFHTLQTLLGSLASSAPGTFTRSPLAMQTTQAPGDLRQLTLQTGPGRYAVVLWREVSVWDPAQGADLSVTPQPVSLTLPPQTNAVTARQLNDSTAMPITVSGAGAVAIPVGAIPVVLQVQRPA